jgi:DNA-binding response OmpR family regulator
VYTQNNSCFQELHCANVAALRERYRERPTCRGIEVQFLPTGVRTSFLATSQSSRVYARFDRFEVDLASGDLRTSEGPPARIQPLPLQVLRLLLEAEGGVVTREQLRATLWSEAR